MDLDGIAGIDRDRLVQLGNVNVIGRRRVKGRRGHGVVDRVRFQRLAGWAGLPLFDQQIPVRAHGRRDVGVAALGDIGPAFIADRLTRGVRRGGAPRAYPLNLVHLGAGGAGRCGRGAGLGRRLAGLGRRLAGCGGCCAGGCGGRAGGGLRFAGLALGEQPAGQAEQLKLLPVIRDLYDLASGNVVLEQIGVVVPAQRFHAQPVDVDRGRAGVCLRDLHF